MTSESAHNHASTATGPKTPFTARTVTTLCCTLFALATWLICYPGFLSDDSISQHDQANSGQFNDWHPPVMAMLLFAAFKVGAGVGSLTLLQSLAGCFGFFHFAFACLRLLTRGRASEDRLRFAALGLLGFFLAPWSPFMYYLMTFWKDTWVLICLLWTGALGLRLVEHVSGGALAFWRFLATFWLFATAATMALLARHNAIALLPLFCIFLFLVLRRAGSKYAWAGCLLPGLLYGVTSNAMSTLGNVARKNHHRFVMANELVGLCVYNESLRAELPITGANLLEDKYREGYLPGNVMPIYPWSPGRIVSAEITHRNHLESEYWEAVRRHPWAIFQVKLAGFQSLLDKNDNWVWNRIVDNEYGLTLNNQNHCFRMNIEKAHARIHDRSNEWVRMICTRNPFWFALNGLFLVGWLGWRLCCGKAVPLLSCIALLLPAGYYLSYLLACAATDYRFLYPATLMVQAITGTLIVAVTLRVMKLRHAP